MINTMKDLKDLQMSDCVDLFPGETDIKVVDVYDGDTFHVIYCPAEGFPVMTHLRLEGIDTPERKSKDQLEKKAGIAVKNFVSGLIMNKVLVGSITKPDKYGGRVIGTLTLESGESLTDLLVANKYGKSYLGKKKEAWTTEELTEILSSLEK